MKHGPKIIQALPSYLLNYYYITGRRLKTTTVQKYRTSRSYNINFSLVFFKFSSALLFDVAPDLEEYSPKQFTFRIGPTTYNNPFEIDETNDPCYAKRFKREKETVDLENLYMEYKTCKVYGYVYQSR